MKVSIQVSLLQGELPGKVKSWDGGLFCVPILLADASHKGFIQGWGGGGCEGEKWIMKRAMHSIASDDGCRFPFRLPPRSDKPTRRSMAHRRSAQVGSFLSRKL